MDKKNNSPFTIDDYNSGDGMMTSVWGPAMWLFLHTMSFNYPVNPTEEQKKHYYKFFKNIQNILPCKYCRDNYKENLKTHKLNKKHTRLRSAALGRGRADLRGPVESRMHWTEPGKNITDNDTNPPHNNNNNNQIDKNTSFTETHKASNIKRTSLARFKQRLCSR
jgi:hypothetical protein